MLVYTQNYLELAQPYFQKKSKENGHVNRLVKKARVKFLNFEKIKRPATGLYS